MCLHLSFAACVVVVTIKDIKGLTCWISHSAGVRLTGCVETHIFSQCNCEFLIGHVFAAFIHPSLVTDGSEACWFILSYCFVYILGNIITEFVFLRFMNWSDAAEAEEPSETEFTQLTQLIVEVLSM